MKYLLRYVNGCFDGQSNKIGSAKSKFCTKSFVLETDAQTYQVVDNDLLTIDERTEHLKAVIVFNAA